MHPVRVRVMAIAALAGLLLAGPARAAEANKYVPGDADVIVYVNVQQLLGSALVKKHALPQIQQALQDNKEAQALLATIGLDPLKDVSTVFLTANSAELQEKQGQNPEKMLLILQGNFKQDKIAAAARQAAKDTPEKLKVHAAGGKSVYEIIGDESAFATFADAGTLIVSPSKDYLLSAAGGKAGKINQELKAAITSLGDPAKKSFWMAALVTEAMRKELGKQQGGAQFAEKLRALTGDATVTDAIALGLMVRTSDAGAARQLAAVANQAKGLAAFAVQDNKEAAELVAEIMKNLQIDSTRNDVNIRLKLTAAVIQKAAKMVPQQ